MVIVISLGSRLGNFGRDEKLNEDKEISAALREKESIPNNAFVFTSPRIEDGTAATEKPETVFEGSDEMKITDTPTPLAIDPLISLREIEKLIGAFVYPEKESDTLSLPEIPDSSLHIVQGGPSDTASFIESFAVNSFGGVEFDGAKFRNIIVDENNLPLLPQRLVEKGIAEKNFAPLKESLVVFREYTLAKQKFAQSLEVSGGAIRAAKEIVGFDALTVELIDKAIAVADGKEQIASVEEFYKRFQATSNLYHNQLLQEAGLAAHEPPSLIKRITEFLSVKEVAHAQVGFGAFVTYPVFCTCSYSYWITMAGPAPPPLGSVVASVAWMATPAFFPYRSIKPGAAWLGTYTGASSCVMYIGYGCTTIGQGNIPIIAGTSI